jgi:hypothetical protein
MPQSAAVRAAHEDDLPLLRREGNPRSHEFNSAALDLRTEPEIARLIDNITSGNCERSNNQHGRYS